VHGPTLPARDERPVDVEDESARADDALNAVADELGALAERAGVSGAVLVRQARLTRDPSLAALVAQFVRTGRSAPRAAWEAFGAYRDMRAADPLRGAPDAAELDDVRDRVVARLLGEPPPGIPDPGTPFVLVARDLSPAVTATLDPSRVLALVTERGGPTSHTAVLAKALGIPAVVGCPGVAALATGQRVAVDGAQGVVTADPDAEMVGALSKQASAASASVAKADGPGRTKDGRPVPLFAAVGGKSDVDDALAAGAEGVGVFRTEFCFLDRGDPPTVSEQTAAYREVFDAFPGRPVTVRTLDVGADKPVPYVRLGDQPNPALGVRGLRVARRQPQLLADQLVAIARAARESKADVRVMAPMVATTAEAAWFATRAREAGVGVVGVMVEIPAAALRAADLLQVVDFVSVGSNDLAQYAFATDREDGELADLLDPWQPAFLDLVATVLRAGSVAGRAVTVCGEAASDPLLATVLVGLGAHGLSMNPRSIPVVRAGLARVTSRQCTDAAAAALSAGGPEEGRARVVALLDQQRPVVQ
jgi:phosphotransferase system enzyme I (PtsI)